MRICYIADAGSIHTQKWVNYFALKGHEVHLISFRGSEGYVEGVQLHLLTRLAPRIWAVSRYLSNLLWLIRTRNLVRRIKPDILNAHYITQYGYLAAATGFHPFTLTPWGSDILTDPKRSSLLRALTKYALKKADRVICVAETGTAELLELGVDPGKMRGISHGIDTQQFNPQRRDERLKKEILGNLNSPTIISIRSLSSIYNMDTLIRAVPLVLREVPGAKFIIGGDGEQKEYLQGLANSLGVLNSVNFIGWIPHNEVPRYLASSDVYVSTSLSDRCPLSLQEAMACELAPVITDIPANREWITDGKNGFIVPIKDPQALAERIVYLLKNEEARGRFGREGRRVIKERAEYEREMERIEGDYRELVEKYNAGCSH